MPKLPTAAALLKAWDAHDKAEREERRATARCDSAHYKMMNMLDLWRQHRQVKFFRRAEIVAAVKAEKKRKR